MKSDCKYYEVIKLLPPFEKTLSCIPANIISAATEIRIRAGRPIVIECINERYICGTRCADLNEIYDCIKNFCNYSIHSCQRELSEGWITLKGGHRAGFAGTSCIRNGKLETINDISAVNIRIAREHKGISDRFYKKLFSEFDIRGLIISGPPLSGKTSFLRDLCRNCGNNRKTALIDERGEIAAVCNGIPQNDIGFNTDVLNYYTKNEGIGQAIRVLSPEIIICDEIGSEVSLVKKMACSGVKFIFTVHCGSIQDAFFNETINELVNSGCVNSIAFLDKNNGMGKLKGLWILDNGKGIDSCCDSNNVLHNRNNCINNSENQSYTAKENYFTVG